MIDAGDGRGMAAYVESSRRAARTVAEMAINELSRTRGPISPTTLELARETAPSMIRAAINNLPHRRAGISTPALDELLYDQSLAAFMERWDELLARLQEGGSA